MNTFKKYFIKGFVVKFLQLIGFFIIILVVGGVTLEDSNKLALSTSCNNPPFFFIQIDNQEYWVQLPTVCHQVGYIFNNSPRLGTFFDGDEITRNKILEQVYARSLTPGGSDSPTIN